MTDEGSMTDEDSMTDEGSTADIVSLTNQTIQCVRDRTKNTEAKDESVRLRSND
jgi:hypothetical protein